MCIEKNARTRFLTSKIWWENPHNCLLSSFKWLLFLTNATKIPSRARITVIVVIWNACCIAGSPCISILQPGRTLKKYCDHLCSVLQSQHNFVADSNKAQKSYFTVTREIAVVCQWGWGDVIAWLSFSSELRQPLSVFNSKHISPVFGVEQGCYLSCLSLEKVPVWTKDRLEACVVLQNS